MIKFRNPGSNISTQIRIMRVLDKVFCDKVFTLDDFAWATTDNNLMTAYGYSGESARDLSNVEDESRNSTKMNVKMYAEVFRLLGWISSYDNDSSYPLIITELGHYVATCPTPSLIYKECIMGISSPQEVIPGVRYREKVRFFLCALETMKRLGGIIYKHELCMGPMSVNDVNRAEMQNMISDLERIRGSYTRYQDAWKLFCANQGMKPTSVDNQTRFPVGALIGCEWAEKITTKDVYPPRKMQCLAITKEGVEALDYYKSCKDLRLNEFNTLQPVVQDALIRIGFYQMLQRAGYDISPMQQQLEDDQYTAEKVLFGKELLFSPYQVLKVTRVNSALGIDTKSYEEFSGIESASKKEKERPAITTIRLSNIMEECSKSEGQEAQILRNRIIADYQNGHTQKQIIAQLCEEESNSNQGRFYPLVGHLFEILGYECRVSRQGDNGARWDAIITAPCPAIPIEIKSPGEEEHISIKAVKQALENKVILLARETYSTTKEVTSLVVGYKLPNQRAEVTALIEAIYKAFGVRIGVISLDVLYKIVVSRVIDNKGLNEIQLEELMGLVGVKA